MEKKVTLVMILTLVAGFFVGAWIMANIQLAGANTQISELRATITHSQTTTNQIPLTRSISYYNQCSANHISSNTIYYVCPQGAYFAEWNGDGTWKFTAVPAYSFCYSEFEGLNMIEAYCHAGGLPHP